MHCGCAPEVLGDRAALGCLWDRYGRWEGRRAGGWHTVDSGEQDSGVVVRDHVGVSVLWFVHLQVGVLPRELLTGVDGLQGKKKCYDTNIVEKRNNRGLCQLSLRESGLKSETSNDSGLLLSHNLLLQVFALITLLLESARYEYKFHVNAMHAIDFQCYH